MILTRLRHDKEPEKILYAVEYDIIKKIDELELENYHRSVYYKKGTEKLINNLEYHDYYVVYDTINEMEESLGIYLSERNYSMKSSDNNNI
tara:strand:+ start:18895 stop:19167 length:273 start_codon:yes stop_codon:yes gene_type:complete